MSKFVSAIFMLSFVVVAWSFPVSAQSDDFSEKLKPISELPAKVKTKAGEIGLFVDWKNQAESKVDVYIVNRSAKAVTLGHAYGNCYLKMEVQNEKMNWDRIELYQDEMCGTGLGQFSFKPGHWIKQSHSVQSTTAAALAKPAVAPAKNPVETVAELQAAIKKIKDFMARARLTKDAYDDYIAKIKGLESDLATAQKAAAMAQAKEAAIGPGANPDTVKPNPKSENRLVRLRLYDFNCRSASNEATMLFSNFAMIESCKRDSAAIRFADIGHLRGIIFDKVRFAPLPTSLPGLSPKVTAVQSLERSWHPVEEVQATLNEIINGKDEKLIEAAKLVRQIVMKRQSK